MKTYVYNQHFLPRKSSIVYSREKLPKFAIAELVTMIAPMMETLALACQLIPIYSLKHEILFDQMQKIKLN